MHHHGSGLELTLLCMGMPLTLRRMCPFFLGRLIFFVVTSQTSARGRVLNSLTPCQILPAPSHVPMPPQISFPGVCAQPRCQPAIPRGVGEWAGRRVDRGVMQAVLPDQRGSAGNPPHTHTHLHMHGSLGPFCSLAVSPCLV